MRCGYEQLSGIGLLWELRCVFLRCVFLSLDKWYPTFRNNVVVSPSKVKCPGRISWNLNLWRLDYCAVLQRQEPVTRLRVATQKNGSSVTPLLGNLQSETRFRSMWSITFLFQGGMMELILEANSIFEGVHAAFCLSVCLAVKDRMLSPLIL